MICIYHTSNKKAKTKVIAEKQKVGKQGRDDSRKQFSIQLSTEVLFHNTCTRTRTLSGQHEQAAHILATKPERKRYQKLLSVSKVTIVGEIAVVHSWLAPV